MVAVSIARAAAREAVLARIDDEAREQLARDGAAGLSLRSVARELGMVSSGIYRYVASRDELLTRLIVQAYDDLGAALEDGLRRGRTPRARWRAVCHALRLWATENPHEYALLYGSPVPGYAAPPDTIGPARRVYEALARAIQRPRPAERDRPVPAALEEDAEVAAIALGLQADADAVLETFGIWMRLFGTVSFELFGHTHGVIGDHDAFFAHQVEAMADALGL
jgi:AcrR family transcriptional regulator